MGRWHAIALCVPVKGRFCGLCRANPIAPAHIGKGPRYVKHVIKHRFCQTCGIHPYGEGTDPKGNRTAAINIRCLEGIDLDSVPVQHFDGRSL